MMGDAVAQFFDSWGMTDDAERLDVIRSLWANNGTYADPRSDGVLTGPDEIAAYVNTFSANAPGWSATLVGSDTIAGLTRALIAFGGKGPDGAEMVQHGQYFVEMDGDSILRMTGFVGTGARE